MLRATAHVRLLTSMGVLDGLHMWWTGQKQEKYGIEVWNKGNPLKGFLLEGLSEPCPYHCTHRFCWVKPWERIPMMWWPSPGDSPTRPAATFFWYFRIVFVSWSWSRENIHHFQDLMITDDCTIWRGIKIYYAIFGEMNIPLPAILVFTRVPGFWPPFGSFYCADWHFVETSVSIDGNC